MLSSQVAARQRRDRFHAIHTLRGARPRRLCAGWCDNDPAKHKLLCETSWEHFGNDWNHTCSRPELWLGGKVDPWQRNPFTGAIVGIEAEPVPPPLRVKRAATALSRLAVAAFGLLFDEHNRPRVNATLRTVAGAWAKGPHANRARSSRPRPAVGEGS